MPISNDLYIWILILILMLSGTGIIILSVKHLPLSIFLMSFSPWISQIPVGDMDGSDSDAGITSYIRISLLLLLGIAGFIKFFLLWSKERPKIPVHLVLLAVFIMLSLISTIYSIDQKYTLIRSAYFLAVICLMFALNFWIKHPSHINTIINAVFWNIVLFIILNYLSMLLLPSEIWIWIDTGRFSGLWGHPNTFGSFCMASYPIFYYKYSQARHNPDPSKRSSGKGIILLVIITLILHIYSGSKTTLIASGAGFLTALLISRKYLRAFILIAAALVTVLIIQQTHMKSFARDKYGDNSLLTGREEFWENAYKLLLERPLTGYGYAVEGKIWEDPRFFKTGYVLWSGSSKTSLHNGYVSAAISLGIFGLLIFTSLLFIPLIKCLKLPLTSYKVLMVQMMTAILVGNISENSINSSMSISTVIFWIVWTMGGRLAVLKPEEESTSEVLPEEIKIIPSLE